MKRESPTEFAAAWREWHVAYEARRADPHGFLAITAMHWLSGEPTRFDDVPGAWSSVGDDVRVRLDPGERLSVDDLDVVNEHVFCVPTPTQTQFATYADGRVEVTTRGGQHVLRPRHPEHALRRDYAGTPTYTPDPRWAVPARLVRLERARDVAVDATLEGLEHHYTSPGHVEFELLGQALRLTAFDDGDDGALLILFTDATSGVTTYPACRELAVAAPDEEGFVTLEFNRATNPPCAYTDFSTCPLPPRENRLPVAIEAGEQLPSRHA